jgi:hypothetical protein
MSLFLKNNLYVRATWIQIINKFTGDQLIGIPDTMKVALTLVRDQYFIILDKFFLIGVMEYLFMRKKLIIHEKVT